MKISNGNAGCQKRTCDPRRMALEKEETSNQESRHMVMKVKTETIANLVDDLRNKLDPFSKHLLNVRWQLTQFELLKKDPPKDWVLLCMDYAENYNCHFQDEAQSAHWSYNQATIHPRTRPRVPIGRTTKQQFTPLSHITEARSATHRCTNP